MSPNIRRYYDYPWGFPRVSGDEPRDRLPGCTSGWFSPRERG